VSPNIGTGQTFLVEHIPFDYVPDSRHLCEGYCCETNCPFEPVNIPVAFLLFRLFDRTLVVVQSQEDFVTLVDRVWTSGTDYLLSW
jgi:hypothetical protein